MSFKKFEEELARGLPAPGYLLSSSDPFLQTEAAHLARELVPAQERDFNFQEFDLTALNEITFDHVLDAMNTMPFFSGRKVIILGNAQKLLKKDSRKLADYFAHPSESTVVLLLHQGPAKKDLKELLGKAKTIPLDLTERELVPWLKSRAASKGFTLSDSAADYLLGTVGADLGLLSSEIEKCSLVGKPVIERQDILDVVDGRKTLNAFALVDAIRARDAELALKICGVLRETEEPYGLLGALNWQYAKSFSGDASSGKGYFYEVFRELNQADLEIKSSGGPYPMELLVIKLLRLSRAR